MVVKFKIELFNECLGWHLVPRRQNVIQLNSIESRPAFKLGSVFSASLCVFSIVFWCYHENELIFKDRSKDPTEQLVLFKALKLKESVTDTGLKLCQQIGIKQHF